VRTEELAPLLPDEQVHLDDGSTATVWSEHLHLDGAQAVARFTDGPQAGVPAVTRHDVGSGTAWYLATRLDDEHLGALVDRLAEEAQVRAAATVPAGVEAVRRKGPGEADDRRYLFLLNHTDEEQKVAATGHDLVADRDVDGLLSLPPGGCAVVRETV
jgi:beta-galactosidase